MSGALADLLVRRWGLADAARPALERLVSAWASGHSGIALDADEASALSKSPALALTLDAASPRPLVLRAGFLQAWRHAVAERDLAQSLLGLAGSPRRKASPDLERAWQRLYPKADDSQARAVRLGLESSLLLLIGGPGTGKTHTAARLLGLLLQDQPDLRFALAAPTGKAAQRLGESVAKAADDGALREALPEGAALLGRAAGRAGTLHRLLDWKPGEDRCLRDARRPLPLDLLIVDEAGMLDLLLWRALLRALPAGCRLLVLGDPLQLESVEPGRVLGDLVEAARAGGPLGPCLAELSRNYRFEAKPGIGALADAVRGRDSRALLAAAPLAAPSGAEVLRFPGGERSLDLALDEVWPEVLALARAEGPESALAALEQLRMLCVMNEGPWGVQALNARVARRLVAAGLGAHARPLLVTVNDPHSGLYNGDLGVLMPGPAGERAVFPGPGGVRSYAAIQVPEHRVAWAMTVHRAQGSEYGTVALVLPPDRKDWVGPELLYTAVTRARMRVILVASDGVLAEACRPKAVRGTGLGAWLA
jgi:exodeoxyribonuclease V alpha subunit